MSPKHLATKKLHKLNSFISSDAITNIWALIIFLVGCYVLFKYELPVSAVSLWIVAFLTSPFIYQMLLVNLDWKFFHIKEHTKSPEMVIKDILRFVVIIFFLIVAVVSFDAATLPILPQ